MGYAFWVIIKVSKGGVPSTTALLDPKDARRTLKFVDASSAYLYIDKMPESPLYMHFPVEVR